jgi:hypothetical protein
MRRPRCRSICCSIAGSMPTSAGRSATTPTNSPDRSSPRQPTQDVESSYRRLRPVVTGFALMDAASMPVVGRHLQDRLRL